VSILVWKEGGGGEIYSYRCVFVALLSSSFILIKELHVRIKAITRAITPIDKYVLGNKKKLKRKSIGDGGGCRAKKSEKEERFFIHIIYIIHVLCVHTTS